MPLAFVYLGILHITHTTLLQHNDEKCIPNPVDTKLLIPIPTIMSVWVEHGEIIRLWF